LALITRHNHVGTKRVTDSIDRNLRIDRIVERGENTVEDREVNNRNDTRKDSRTRWTLLIDRLIVKRDEHVLERADDKKEKMFGKKFHGDHDSKRAKKKEDLRSHFPENVS